eukprot:204300-Amorphochlora_amoeboformis.AAC.1
MKWICYVTLSDLVLRVSHISWSAHPVMAKKKNRSGGGRGSRGRGRGGKSSRGRGKRSGRGTGERRYANSAEDIEKFDRQAREKEAQRRQV